MELLVLPSLLPADIRGVLKLYLPKYTVQREGQGRLVDWSVRGTCGDIVGGNRLIVSIEFELVYRQGNYRLPSPVWPYGRSGWPPNTVHYQQHEIPVLQTGDYRTEDYFCWYGSNSPSTRLSYWGEGNYIESEHNQ